NHHVPKRVYQVDAFPQLPNESYWLNIRGYFRNDLRRLLAINEGVYSDNGNLFPSLIFLNKHSSRKLIYIFSVEIKCCKPIFQLCCLLNHRGQVRISGRNCRGSSSHPELKQAVFIGNQSVGLELAGCNFDDRHFVDIRIMVQSNDLWSLKKD